MELPARPYEMAQAFQAASSRGCLLPRGRCKRGTCYFPRQAVLQRVPVPPVPALKPVLGGPTELPSIKASSDKHHVTSSKCPLRGE